MELVIVEFHCFDKLQNLNKLFTGSFRSIIEITSSGKPSVTVADTCLLVAADMVIREMDGRTDGWANRSID